MVINYDSSSVIYDCNNVYSTGHWKTLAKIICGLYYKHILTIVSDDHKWSLYYKCAYDRNWALASVINYDRKWCYNLERHLLTTLGASIMIVIRL